MPGQWSLTLLEVQMHTKCKENKGSTYLSYKLFPLLGILQSFGKYFVSLVSKE